ncbi:testis-expressed protein 36 [Echeneis naucrates]|uniref:testis-expressed protein 36 n=1 Tax=Echeneis naucrates TaxID=173247 RepID=UPI0011141C9F|nr:testis-expressed protein 36 [Echeneis naucrates]
MVRDGKPMINDGKWFAHPVSPQNETRRCGTCASTGIMLTKSALPQALNFERYPKWKTQQKSREYPFSDHDNKEALKDNIFVFTHGVGRRKCLDHRQHNSHFCLCHDGADAVTAKAGGNLTAYQADFTVKQACNVPTSTRRFPRNHKQKSADAALVQAGELLMWFGRHDFTETPQVLAATKRSAHSKP